MTRWNGCVMWLSERSVKTTEYSSKPSGSTAETGFLGMGVPEGCDLRGAPGYSSFESREQARVAFSPRNLTAERVAHGDRSRSAELPVDGSRPKARALSINLTKSRFSSRVASLLVARISIRSAVPYFVISNATSM